MKNVAKANGFQVKRIREAEDLLQDALYQLTLAQIDLRQMRKGQKDVRKWVQTELLGNVQAYALKTQELLDDIEG